MAIGDPYILLEELKDYMKMTGSSQDDDKLQNAMQDASVGINGFCNRQFNRTTTASLRKYDLTASGIAVVDDFWTTDELVVSLDGSTLTEDSDYELRPLNGVVDGEPGWPYWRIKLLGFRSNIQRYCNSGARLQVTAQWGWASVPAPVKQACFIMAAETFQLKDAPLGVAGADAFGTVMRVRNNPMASNKLARYVRDKVLVG